MTERLTDEALERMAWCDPLAAELLAYRRAGVAVKPLEWHKSHITPWNDDWHTVPTVYTIRCCDENGWKWSANGAFGYAHSANMAKLDAQRDHEARIRSCLVTPPPASRADADLRAAAATILSVLQDPDSLPYDQHPDWQAIYNAMTDDHKENMEINGPIEWHDWPSILIAGLEVMSAPRPDEGDGA